MDRLPVLWFFIHKVYSLLYFHRRFLPLICLLLVLASIAPGLVKLARNPSNRNFILSIQQCALCFYILGFAMHEKSIMWYMLSLSFSLFHYPPSLLSFINLVSVLLLSPMTL